MHILTNSKINDLENVISHLKHARSVLHLVKKPSYEMQISALISKIEQDISVERRKKIYE